MMTLNPFIWHLLLIATLIIDCVYYLIRSTINLFADTLFISFLYGVYILFNYV